MPTSILVPITSHSHGSLLLSLVLSMKFGDAKYIVLFPLEERVILLHILMGTSKTDTGTCMYTDRNKLVKLIVHSMTILYSQVDYLLSTELNVDSLVYI